MSALRRIIEQSPPGSLFTREGLLAIWDDASSGPVRWVSVLEVHEITGIPCGTLRAGAMKWRAMMEAGSSPPIRVRKKGPRPRSPWLFDEGDCWAYRRRHGGGPRLEGPFDSRAALIASYVDRATSNL